ncbi:MAG: Gfo/Idh/MocA family oxidoreductase [Armatimonadetes bacterium]|nr:Gfo/Idh/MocA family oxidoreductase [Armatimonadota bacterium]
MSKVFNVGLIGCGFMGRMHSSVYGTLSQANLKVCCAKHPESATKLAAPHGATVETDWKRVVSDDNLDAVDICLPTFLHAEVAITALENGKHVFCEKPMALTYEEAEKMAAAAKSSGKKLMIGHCIRFWNEYVTLTELVRSERFGKLLSLNLTRYGEFPSWSSEGWIGKENLAGGAALDMHIHDTDYALHLLGEPTEVKSFGTYDGRGLSQIFTTMAFGKTIVHLEGGWNLPPGTPFKMAFRAIFENGAAIMDGSPLTLYPASGQPEIPAYQAMGTATGSGNISDLSGYFHELNYFYNELGTGGNMDKVTPESALLSLKVTLQEIEQAKGATK